MIASMPPDAVSDISLGVLAGLGTSVCWTGTSVFFNEAVRRLGPTVVNLARLFLAMSILCLIHRAIAGQWVPDLHARQVVLLAASGLVGLTIGDQALLTAFVDVGPRMGTLVMTTAPVFAALFGWLALGETIGPIGMGGMALTIAGVAWVVFERPKTVVGLNPPHRMRGILFAVLAAACQAGGLLLSKAGMGHGWLEPAQHAPPLTATFVRMTFAALTIAPLYPLLKWREKRMTIATPPRESPSQVRRRGALFLSLGAICGPVTGVWLSLVAADLAPVGIAQTAASLAPIFLLPIAWRLYREPISPRAVFGACAAVAGVAILALAPGNGV